MNYSQAFKSLRELNTPIIQKERFNYNIKSLKQGSFVKIKGELFQVKNVFTYKEGKEQWFEYELFSISTGLITYIEYEEDDKIDMYITSETFNVRELPVSMDDVEDMADEESGKIELRMNTFYYEDDYQATFIKGDVKDTVYLYEFSNESEDTFLTIEEWGNKTDGYEYQCFISKKLEEIEVVSI